jgi:hypothetical protein
MSQTFAQGRWDDDRGLEGQLGCRRMCGVRNKPMGVGTKATRSRRHRKVPEMGLAGCDVRDKDHRVGETPDWRHCKMPDGLRSANRRGIATGGCGRDWVSVARRGVRNSGIREVGVELIRIGRGGAFRFDIRTSSVVILGKFAVKVLGGALPKWGAAIVEGVVTGARAVLCCDRRGDRVGLTIADRRTANVGGGTRRC